MLEHILYLMWLPLKSHLALLPVATGKETQYGAQYSEEKTTITDLSSH